jgi:hypothetical protein
MVLLVHFISFSRLMVDAAAVVAAGAVVTIKLGKQNMSECTE